MAVPSPCIDVCKFDRDTCIGCLRTRDEIQGWRKYTDHKRCQILVERRIREAKRAIR